MRHLLESGYFWLLLSFFLLLACIGLTVKAWGWLHPTGPTTVSNSDTLRNVGLLTGGLLAFVFAGWRAWVAERQANAAQLQAETADRGLLNDRYQKATEMLGSSVLTVRLGGIQALQGLAQEHPERYHVPVMQLLCSFVRHPTEVEGQPIVDSEEFELGIVFGASTAQDFAAAGTEEIKSVREDIHAAMESITACHHQNLQIETLQNYRINLSGADLRNVNLTAKDLSGAPVVVEVEASCRYPSIDYWYTNLRGTKLHCAGLRDANLTRVDLSHATGLTQSTLNDAYADPTMPPRLDYTFDVDSGERLVWNSSTNHK